MEEHTPVIFIINYNSEIAAMSIDFKDEVGYGRISALIDRLGSCMDMTVL